MDWISIGLAGLSGAVAAAIASLVVRNPKEKRALYTVVGVVCFVALQGLSREFIFPALNAWNQVRKNAETGKTYPNIGEYSLVRCEFIAQLTEKAAQLRDTGGSRQKFLDIIQKASLDDEEKVKEDKFALAQTAAIMAYENPSLSPKKIFEAMMTVCTNEYITRVAENQGKAIGGMRTCAIDSLQHEALLEEVFQLLTTDATTLAAARQRAREAMERTIGLITEFRNKMGWSTEDYMRITCTQETRDASLKDTRTLSSAKQEILERNAKNKPNP